MEMQASLERRYQLTRPTVIVGKVITIHQGNGCTVDVALLSGGFLRDVPVLSPFASTVSGLTHLTAPTVDANNPTRSTYEAGAPANVEEIGPANSAGVAQAPAATPGSNRDIYVVLIQCEGNPIGTAGFFALGFLFSTNGEMLFPADGLLIQLADLLLYRHPSDLQVTTDKYGTTSWQHPAGARIAIGDNHALDESTVADNFLDLTGKDQNSKYQLRANLTRQPVIVSELKGKSKIIQNADGSITVSNQAGASTTLNPDGSTTIKDAFGDEVDMNANGITLKSSLNVTIKARDVILDLEFFTTTLNTFFGQYDTHEHPIGYPDTGVPLLPNQVPPNPTPSGPA